VSETNKILVVDDDPGMCETLADVLTARGQHVVTAGRGRDALHELRDQRVGATIIDLNLPDISGLDLLERIRQASPSGRRGHPASGRRARRASARD